VWVTGGLTARLPSLGCELQEGLQQDFLALGVGYRRAYSRTS